MKGLALKLDKYNTRYLVALLYCCCSTSIILAQETVKQQKFVIKVERIFDYEKLFTAQEVQTLDSVVSGCRENGIADIAIITIDDRHTNAKDFDNYVFSNLTSYASGEYGKNNGIVIALSKKLRRIRVENGYGIEKVLSNEATKKIIDQQFIPKFRAGNYFAGTLRGLHSIVAEVDEAMQRDDFTNASSIFLPSTYKRIRNFVLENGTPKTFRDLDGNNPSYKFASMEVFLGPSRNNSYLLKDFQYDDYYEMTIRHQDGNQYQFVYFENSTPEQTFIHKKMQPERVYWWHPKDKTLSADVWPLLTQLEDEIARKAIDGEGKHFTAYQWMLKQEFHPMERTFMDIDNNDTLQFNKDQIFINGEYAGNYQMNFSDKILKLKIDKGKRPSFAIFPIEESYNYRYLFHPAQKALYLVPLDEIEGDEFICVEGCTLLFEIVKK